MFGRIQQYFPSESKASRDSSSIAAKLLSSLEEATDINVQNAIANKRNNLSPEAGKWPCFYHQILDSLPIQELFYGSTVGTFTLLADGLELEQVSTIDLLLAHEPTRITVTETDIESIQYIEDSIVVSQPENSYLWIVISESTHYDNAADINTSGNHCIYISGYDYWYNELKEKLIISDDGTYRSKYKYSNISKIESEGFNGRIDAYNYKPDTFTKLDLPIVVSREETPALIGIEDNALAIYSSPHGNGSLYRRDGVVHQEQYIEEIPLHLDIDGEDIISCTVDPYSRKFICLSDTKLSWFTLDNIGFSAATENDSLITFVELQPLSNYAKLDRTEYLWTKFIRVRELIGKIYIKRISPTGTVRYIDTDLQTWTATETGISSVNWKDFRISTTYDELGTWEYHIYTTSKSGLTRYVTQVKVIDITPLISLDHGIEDPSHIWFEDRTLYIKDNNNLIYQVDELIDCFLLDPLHATIYTLHNYEGIEVT